MGNKGATGPFAPLVIAIRNVYGTKNFNLLRGKAISLHSQGTFRKKYGLGGVERGQWSIKMRVGGGVVRARKMQEIQRTNGKKVCSRSLAPSSTFFFPFSPSRKTLLPTPNNKKTVIKEFGKSIGVDSKQVQGLIRLAKKNGEKLGFLA